MEISSFNIQISSWGLRFKWRFGIYSWYIINFFISILKIRDVIFIVAISAFNLWNKTASLGHKWRVNFGHLNYWLWLPCCFNLGLIMVVWAFMIWITVIMLLLDFRMWMSAFVIRIAVIMLWLCLSLWMRAFVIRIAVIMILLSLRMWMGAFMIKLAVIMFWFCLRMIVGTLMVGITMIVLLILILLV